MNFHLVFPRLEGIALGFLFFRPGHNGADPSALKGGAGNRGGTAAEGLCCIFRHAFHPRNDTFEEVW